MADATASAGASGAEGQGSSPYSQIIEKHRPNISPYEDLYKRFHQNPELSTQEKETAALVVQKLKDLSPDLDIRTNIGGHGLIAIFKNGPGKTVLLRADMDALPIPEKTGLPYASTKKMQDTDGEVKSCMHACGHDFHVTSQLVAAETLIAAKSSWSGTIVFLFQPAEERGSGAKAMVDDGLYDESKHACPIPDVVLGQHVLPLPTGVIATNPGPTMSAANSLKITIFGRGGHGSMPHRTIDAVVIASHVVVRLQTIVSREVAPNERAVVTVGALNAGHTENVISDEAVLKVNVRTMNVETREKVLSSIKRIVQAECVAGNCPQEPTFEPTSSFPLTDNDKTVNEAVGDSFDQHFGAEKHIRKWDLALGSEDFGILGSAIEKPYFFWFFGGFDPEKYPRHEDVPVNHSPYFAPVLQPTLTTGADAMVVAALTCLAKDGR